MHIELNGISYHGYTAAREHTSDRETVVFIHGTSMDHTVWNLQSRYFAYHGYNTLAMNLPGHGFSEGPLLTSIEAMADWLREIVDRTSGTGVHLVGHSMGSLICLQAASGYTDSKPLLSLSLVGFSYPMSVTPVLLDAAKNQPAEAYSMMTQWSHTSQLGGEPNPGFWSPGMQMSMMSNANPDAVYQDLMACNDYAGAESALQNLQTPTLFISGLLDKMAPCKLARKHAEASTFASIEQIPQAGHSIMSEKPDEVLKALQRFIRANPIPA
ncbi:MAG: alpha/beta hydrolase [Pseudomonadota bacterium]